MAKRACLMVIVCFLASLLAVSCGSPTPSPVPPVTPTPTPAPAPSPPSEPTPPPKTEAIGVQNCWLTVHDLYKAKSNTPYSVQAVLTGEVVNNTSDNVKLIRLLVKLKQLDKEVPLQGTIDGKRIEILIPILRPGEISPFTVCAATGYDVTDFEVKLDEYTPTTNQLFYDLELIESQGMVETFDPPLAINRCANPIPLASGYVVRGKIKNTGDKEARFVQIICTFYDDSGRVVDADKQPLDFTVHLAPGEEDTFTTAALCSPELISGFKIQAVAE